MRRYYGRPLDDPSHAPFRCDGYVDDGRIHDEQGTAIPLVELPPFLRALLVTDGTVTKALEAYFWEPVTVDTLEQRFETAQAAVPWIGVDAGDRCLVRDARLRGVRQRARLCRGTVTDPHRVDPGRFPPPADRSRDRHRRPDPRQRSGELPGGAGRGDGPRRGRGRGRLPDLSDHHRRSPRDPDYRTLSAGLVCTVTPLLDTVRPNETPEGVHLGSSRGSRGAQPGVGAGHWYRLARYPAVAVPLGIAGFGVGTILIGIFRRKGPPGGLEVWTGATPGKRAHGACGGPRRWHPRGPPASAIRNGLRAIDFFRSSMALAWSAPWWIGTSAGSGTWRPGPWSSTQIVDGRSGSGSDRRREGDRAAAMATRRLTGDTPPPGVPPPPRRRSRPRRAGAVALAGASE